MPDYRIVMTQTFGQPVAEVYARLADHDRLGEVFGVPVARVKQGAETPNGVGSIRRIGKKPLAIEETVTAAEPNRTIDYRISKGGAPLRNHRGRIVFHDAQPGARVQWTIEFEAPRIAGALIRAVLQKGIERGLKRVARRA